MIKATSASSYFGILLPALMLLKPQVENHLEKECINIAAGENMELVNIMQKPCAAIAAPIATCLLKEAERTNNVLKIISEVISKKYGEGSETVTKGCIAKTLGIPVESLKDVPLAKIFEQKQTDSDKKKTKCDAEIDSKSTPKDTPTTKPRR